MVHGMQQQQGYHPKNNNKNDFKKCRIYLETGFQKSSSKSFISGKIDVFSRDKAT